MAVDIDEIDRRILRQLQKDTSPSLDVLAERVSLSRNACWRRIRRMEEAGIIRARVAHLDAAALGLGLSVFVMIRVGSHEPGWMDRFQAAIAAMPEIQGAHRMTGDLDYVLRVRVADVADYDRFYKALIAQVAVADVSASFVMEDIKDTTALPICGGRGLRPRAWRRPPRYFGPEEDQVSVAAAWSRIRRQVTRSASAVSSAKS